MNSISRTKYKSYVRYNNVKFFYYDIINVEGDFIGAFCTMYYVLSYIAFIPKNVKSIKTKSSNDYGLCVITLKLVALIS